MERSDWESFIERRIREAMEQGEFDNLRGQGRPLPDDEENPFEAPDRRLAYHLLKSNGFTLPWIARRQEIMRRRERIAIPLRRAHDLYHARVAFRPEDGLAEATWQRARDAFRQEIVALNREIDGYNLIVPSDAFRLMPLVYEMELARALVGVAP